MTVKCPTHQEIAARAYQLFVERGRQPGYDVDDWLQAEYELMELPVHKLAELGSPAAFKAAKNSSRKGSSIVEIVRAAMML